MEKLVRVASTPERIREAMDTIGMSQADLTASTGLSHSTISRYVSGKMEPDRKSVV